MTEEERLNDQEILCRLSDKLAAELGEEQLFQRVTAAMETVLGVIGNIGDPREATIMTLALDQVVIHAVEMVRKGSREKDALLRAPTNGRKN